ncbi:reticulocalbin-1 [Hyalella azteca]|uniref:Reticulocalbin-1 n=1 Tax=Hyalella azteca TaxID=294128 RepID=A0A979FLA2_HYAAZ|nr:reticulocalbin-1 [Hyalella azteca]
MDVDQDNKVSWEELEQYQHDAADDGTDDDTDDDDDSNDVVVSARLLELKQRKLQEARELFDAADADDDNFLNETEHQAFREPDRFDHTLEVLYRQTMERKDTDGDGSLNKQEFVTNVDVDEDARPAEFEDEDDNDDGLMTKEELMAWLRHDYSTEVEATVAGLLAADSDGDQRLTLSELKSAPRTLRRHPLLLEGARLVKALDERRARDEL